MNNCYRKKTVLSKPASTPESAIMPSKTSTQHTTCWKGLLKMTIPTSTMKQRVVGDYMQTAAILDSHFRVMSGVNTPNDYMGPGTGYRVEGSRWEEIKKIPHIINPKDI